MQELDDPTNNPGVHEPLAVLQLLHVLGSA